MARYIICPRCELNFIDADEREYCEVCEKELSGDTSYVEALEEEAAEDMELCPLCGEVYVKLGEKMCEECARKSEYEDEVDVEDADKEDDTWRSYLDDDDTEDLGITVDDADFGLEEEEQETYADEEWEEVSADDYDESLDDDDDDDF